MMIFETNSVHQIQIGNYKKWVSPQHQIQNINSDVRLKWYYMQVFRSFQGYFIWDSDGTFVKRSCSR